MGNNKPNGPRLMEGKKIVDATKSITLAIRTSDIKYGIGAAPDACAAAIACVRQFVAISARVHPGRTYIEFEDRWVRYATPKALHDEIVDFDAGKGFSPGIYQLLAISPGRNTAARREATKANRNKPKAASKRKPRVTKTIRERPHFAVAAPTTTAHFHDKEKD